MDHPFPYGPSISIWAIHFHSISKHVLLRMHAVSVSNMEESISLCELGLLYVFVMRTLSNMVAIMASYLAPINL